MEKICFARDTNCWMRGQNVLLHYKFLQTFYGKISFRVHGHESLDRSKENWHSCEQKIGSKRGHFQEHNFVSISFDCHGNVLQMQPYYSMEGGIKHASEGQTITRCGKKLTTEKQKHARNRNPCEAFLVLFLASAFFFQGIHICLSAQWKWFIRNIFE